MPACIDVIGRHIAESFVIALVVVVLDECFNRFLQLTRHLVGHEANLSFDSSVVSFYLAVGLGVEGRSQYMPDAYESQMLSKLPGKVARTIV